MSEKTKKAPATKPVATPKTLRKLVPRTAPKAEVKPLEVVAEAIVAPAAKLAPAPAPVATEKPAPVVAKSAPAASKPKVVRKPTQVEETVAKHQKVLADALVKAQAIKYDQPKVMKQEAKAAKPAKAKKVKLVRDSYAMPDSEYAQIGELKKRLSGLGSDVKKSELLRGGIALLAALNDAELKAVMGRVKRIKTGRPAK
ncbi:MAG: hypothetical protein HGA71_03410 [Azonexaceae bacterium]|nr:hypothetical protein [Azonexaceae bacterium]